MGRLTAIVVAVLVLGCSGCSDRSTTPPPQPGASTTAPPPPSRGIVAAPSSPTDKVRRAPDAIAGPVRLTQIQVRTKADGTLVLQANVTNTSAGFLNAAGLSWRLLDAKGATLATGTTNLTLAPGETSTLNTEAKAGPSWTRITFQLR